MIIHLAMAIISAMSYSGSSFVQSEGAVCRVIYPLNHFVYFILNIVLIFLYAGSLISASTTETDYFNNVRVFGFILVMFSVYTIFLKFMSDLSCEFWDLPWKSVFGHMTQFILEGVFIMRFFDWYYVKIRMLKEAMLQSAKYLM